MQAKTRKSRKKIDDDKIARVDVGLGDRSYPILIGEGLLPRCGEIIAEHTGVTNVFILTDDNLSQRWQKQVEDGLEKAGIELRGVFVLEPGEAGKNFDTIRDVTDGLLRVGVERGSAIIALGGGVVGDIGGFAAAITLRGIKFIQVPTTLLAQVDSSVGGKTGINTTQGKNLVGAFYQPSLVIADIDCLATLPERELLAGYAEVVKYGLIDTPEFFEWLEDNLDDVLDGEEDALRHIVAISCKAKAAIVEKDERESGMRALLNLGHTFGHALESACGYDGSLRHGEAVAIGTVMAFRLANRLDLCPAEDAERVEKHLEAAGLPTTAPFEYDVDRLYKLMKRDKKVKDGRINFILPRRIGEVFVCDTVEEDDVKAVLTDMQHAR